MKKSEIYKLFPHHTKSMLNEALILYNSKRNYQLENRYTFNYDMFDTILFGLDNGAYAVYKGKPAEDYSFGEEEDDDEFDGELKEMYGTVLDEKKVFEEAV